MDFLSAIGQVNGFGSCPNCQSFGPMGGAYNRTMGPMAGLGFMQQNFAMQQLMLQLLSMLLPLMLGRNMGGQQQQQQGSGPSGVSGPTGSTGGVADPLGTGSSQGAPNLSSNSAGAPKGTHQARGTGYFPDSSAMEGGYVDRKGHRLYTLQDYLAGRAPYVSVAMDKNMHIPYGTKLRIKELEQKYGRPIEFRVVDTGGAFTGKGTGRIDICTANSRAASDPTINGPLTLDFG